MSAEDKERKDKELQDEVLGNVTEENVTEKDIEKTKAGILAAETAAQLGQW